jgi:hypothetical protein
MTEREGSLGRVPLNAAPAAAACSCVSGFLSYKLLGRDPGLIARSRAISPRSSRADAARFEAITGGICAGVVDPGLCHA